MEFHLIWGQDKNGGIGNNNSLPWHISSDLKNFKKLTLNSPIIMGRRTWESLKIKPLPKRRNIVLSTNQLKNVEYYNTINTCIQKLKKDNLNKVFIIGGAQVYKKFFPYADYLHITLIEKTISLESLISKWPKDRKLIYCDEKIERGNTIYESLLKYKKTTKKWALIVGPEGGFSNVEKQILINSNFVIPISLGERLLRSDTAITVSLFTIQQIFS